MGQQFFTLQDLTLDRRYLASIKRVKADLMWIFSVNTKRESALNVIAMKCTHARVNGDSDYGWLFASKANLGSASDGPTTVVIGSRPGSNLGVKMSTERPRCAIG